MQVPEPHDPNDAVARPHGRVHVVDRFLFLPYDNGHVERDAVHVDDDAEHAVEHAQRQRQLERAVDAREQLHARAVHVPQVAHVGGAERGYAGPRPSAAGRRPRRPAPPPRVLRLVHQRLDVVVQRPQPQVHRHAHQIEQLLDHDARDVRQRREQAYQFGRTEREPSTRSVRKMKKKKITLADVTCTIGGRSCKVPRSLKCASTVYAVYCELLFHRI